MYDDLLDKRILVTGGAGFIGSTLCRRLVALGARSVRIVDNFSTGTRDNISGLAIEVIEGDIRDIATVERAVDGVEVVFHEAAQINPAKAVEEPLFDFAVNVTGTVNLLFAAIRSGTVRRFLMASTNLYASADIAVAVETVPVLALRKTLLSPYAAAKASAECYLKVAADEYGLETVRLRYSNVIGPGQLTKSESGVVALFTEWAFAGEPLKVFGAGAQRRDFVHVDDVVTANLLGAVVSEATGEVFNVGVGIETSILELAEWIRADSGCDTKIVHLPERRADFLRANIDLAKSAAVLGYKPTISPREGVRQYVDWYRNTKLPR